MRLSADYYLINCPYSLPNYRVLTADGHNEGAHLPIVAVKVKLQENIKQSRVDLRNGVVQESQVTYNMQPCRHPGLLG